MRTLLLVAALLLAGQGVVFADSLNTVVNETTTGAGRITVTVFNDAGTTIVSGAVVVWDTDDTEYDNTGYPYITTTTTADDIDTAGVMLTGSCTDQTLCEIIVAGWAPTFVSVATLTEDTLVSTSTTASSIGDSTAGNNVCSLGVLRAYTSISPGSVGRACTTSQLCLVPVHVDVTCVP